MAVPVDLPPSSSSRSSSCGLLALLDANPSIASDRLRPGPPCSALNGLTSPVPNRRAFSSQVYLAQASSVCYPSTAWKFWILKDDSGLRTEFSA
ncbi:hypothetical protein TgHK011_002026 [Trichoderma gracile]|nr:hypothetical protein TgHK011_002026 [Trichoderma gracile]